MLERRQAAVRDSLITAARNDSLRTAALRDSLRLTRDRARMTALRDSLERVALRDSLRAMTAAKNTRVTLRGVNFEINKAVLLPVSRDILGDRAGRRRVARQSWRSVGRADPRPRCSA